MALSFSGFDVIETNFQNYILLKIEKHFPTLYISFLDEDWPRKAKNEKSSINQNISDEI